jgi:hypothetical protein
MWSFSLRRAEHRRAAWAAVPLLLSGLCFEAPAGEILELRVETAQLRPQAIRARMAVSGPENFPVSPVMYENGLDQVDVYALSPGAIFLHLPRSVDDGAATGRVGAVREPPLGRSDPQGSVGVVNPWAEEIDRAAREFEVDPALIAAVIRAESAFYAQAVSGKGARGLMQLMPATGRAMGLDDPFDPEDNIRAGTRYLKAQLMNFATPEEALAAYNAGPGKVSKYGGIPPFAETRDFVRRVTGYWKGARALAGSPLSGAVHTEERTGPWPGR